MLREILSHKQKFLIAFLFLFSLLSNQYYGNKGIFPIESFCHFDVAFRVLNGEVPFEDYWIVSGPIIDYIQAVFFYIFGANWQSYVLHASFFNSVLTISTFYLLKNLKLNIYYCFFYSIFFALLAYPSIGTPYVDHHSAFFSLLGIYILIIAIKTEKKLYWFLLPIFFGFAFLSKQVPSSYVILLTILILLIYSIVNRKFLWINYSSAGFLLFIFFIFIFGKYQGIKFSSFFDQYILFPLSVGDQRYENFTFTFRGVIGHFKFIYLAIFPLFTVNLIKIFNSKNYLKENDFFYFLSIASLTVSLIWHQLITVNQTFIFFLIPILFAFSQICLQSLNIKFYKLIGYFLIFICFFATVKYHVRFNENRKFQEFENTNFELSVKAEILDKKFVGLKWITPEFSKNPEDEIFLLQKIKLHLTNDNRRKMLMTNYSFFSTILDQKIVSPNRWFNSCDCTYPLKNNKYYYKYKNFITNLIKKNNIEVVYLIKPIENSEIYQYLNKGCFKEVKINEYLSSYELNDCFKN